MDEASYLRIVRGQAHGIGAAAIRLALSAASMPYRSAVAIRNLAFDRGWKASYPAGVPVVSIGNLTVGGTGKTPMVEWVARWFRARSLRVAILSRGYGHQGGLNDEGRVLEENLPDVPHLQGVDRVALARIALEELESQILVLDDGFQHRRLCRDLDIVLLDALEPFGLGRVLPRGLLREPIRSLRRAGVVVVSRADLVAPIRRAEIKAEAERVAGPLRWVESRHAPTYLVAADGSVEPLEGLTDHRVAAFCGIGNPEGFRRTLEAVGANVVGFRAFGDHHPYASTDVAEIGRWAVSLGADLLLTTQKDSVKLRVPSIGPARLRALRIGLEIMEGEAILVDALSSIAPGP